MLTAIYILHLTTLTGTLCYVTTSNVKATGTVLL